MKHRVNTEGRYSNPALLKNWKGRKLTSEPALRDSLSPENSAAVLEAEDIVEKGLAQTASVVQELREMAKQESTSAQGRREHKREPTKKVKKAPANKPRARDEL